MPHLHASGAKPILRPSLAKASSIPISQGFVASKLSRANISLRCSLQRGRRFMPVRSPASRLSIVTRSAVFADGPRRPPITYPGPVTHGPHRSALQQARASADAGSTGRELDPTVFQPRVLAAVYPGEGASRALGSSGFFARRTVPAAPGADIPTSPASYSAPLSECIREIVGGPGGFAVQFVALPPVAGRRGTELTMGA